MPAQWSRWLTALTSITSHAGLRWRGSKNRWPPSDMPRIRELMATYADREMDLADAALVHVAEREGVERIFTVDRTDFTVYRINGQDVFQLLP